MGLGTKIKSLLGTVKQHVEYECKDCDYETARKNFEDEHGNLQCPNCGSTRIKADLD